MPSPYAGAQSKPGVKEIWSPISKYVRLMRASLTSQYCFQFQLKESGSVTDLIRLDSISKEESFDPLEGADIGEGCIAFPTGLTNPLYPYYKLNGSSGERSDRCRSLDKPNSNSSFLHGTSKIGSQELNKQDLDLLKEYGIEFNKNGNQGISLNKADDPFEISFDNCAISRQKSSHSNWATFD